MSEAPLNHPTAEELRALSLGQLTDAELARISAHLGDCPTCCSRIDQLAADDPLVSRLQQSASRQGEMLVSAAQRRSAVRALRQGQEARTAVEKRGPGTEQLILPAPRQVGDYDILAEIGRGGMGVVYKARHRSLLRLAALKMVLAGEFASPTQELRFRLEAELAARVQHPNIVQVYEIGSYEGRPFLAMEWVEGGSLANRLDGKPWPPGAAAALIETLARAIHVAHGEGVVHRDLKPANILLSVVSSPSSVAGTDGQRTTDNGQRTIPKITDFGLAQPTEGGMTLTQSGFLVGTPGYMAPEQAGGKRALVGPATDVYALGVVLYQLLTGQLPFRGASALEVLRAVTSDEPVRPRRLQPRLPRDLEAITLHCLEKEPSRRYASALALAEDLERFRQKRQVMARPVGAVARLARACRRRPVITLLLTLLMIAVFGGLAGVTWKWLEADEQRDRANANALQATDEKREAQFQAYRARIAAAAAALSGHDVADAARQLEEVPEDRRGWEWRHLHSRLDDSFAVIPLPASKTNFRPSNFLASSILIGGPERIGVAAETSDGLRLLDLESGKHRTIPIDPERQRPLNAAQTSAGTRVVVWVGDTAFDLLDDTGQVLCRVESPQIRTDSCVAVSPDGTRLACQLHAEGKLRRIAVFDAKTGKQITVCDGHHAGVWNLVFSPDNTRLVSTSDDRTARLWNPVTGALLATCEGHTDKLLSAAFRPDGARLVTTSADGTVRQWDTETGEEVEAPYDRHTGEATVATYSPDGQWVASAGSDRTVRVWQAKGRQDLAILHGHTGIVDGVAFAPEGGRLASLSRDTALGLGDNTVRVWDVDPQATLPVLRGHTSYVYPVAFSPDGRWIASGGWDKENQVRLWDAATGEECATLPHAGSVLCLAFSPNQPWLVTGTLTDTRLRFWDLATAQVCRDIKLGAGSLRSLTISPDGKRVAATVWDSQERHHLYVCDVTSGAVLFSADACALAYSPDGHWLAVQAADGKAVLLLDAQTHEKAARFEGHKETVRSATFSPDSRRLASCSSDGTVRLWQVDGGACQRLLGHTDEVFAVAFHPDGTRLATAGRDRAVWLWDLARGEEVARLPGHTRYVWSLAFSPDGTTLASGSGDFTVRLWDTAPLKTRYDARRAAAALRPEADRLVEQLWREKNEPAEVAEALRADPALSEPLRQAALREVLRRAQPPETAPANPRDPP